jgi:hypothetical protein
MSNVYHQLSMAIRDALAEGGIAKLKDELEAALNDTEHDDLDVEDTLQRMGALVRDCK